VAGRAALHDAAEAFSGDVSQRSIGACCRITRRSKVWPEAMCFPNWARAIRCRPTSNAPMSKCSRSRKCTFCESLPDLGRSLAGVSQGPRRIEHLGILNRAKKLRSSYTAEGSAAWEDFSEENSRGSSGKRYGSIGEDDIKGPRVCAPYGRKLYSRRGMRGSSGFYPPGGRRCLLDR